ncbi:DOMON domain-containing protein [Thermococcus paralvinellae]|uniref:DOMON domain-containing protein n=1 Tax=Thermococcus paralvinellae TaxID=582419 RepID=W0I189_9EURY|nr:DOMON domain-containing protein [Thermococcus paralvinellae]AHF79811.1 Hypothetical protein TES1_0417 [Thermococcus paralvinellae]
MKSQTLLILWLVVSILLLSGCIEGKQGSTTTAETNPATLSHLREWKADGVISPNEYPHKQSLAGGKFIVYWRNDGEYLYMALKGQTTGWVAIGFEPSNAMKDADIIFGWVKNGQVIVIDAYSTGTYGPHPPDEELGGTNDILEYAGKEEDEYTVIEFKRRLDTGDHYDKSLIPSQKVKFIFALADSDEFTQKHNIIRGSGELTLDKA